MDRCRVVVEEIQFAVFVLAEATMRTDGRAISGISFVRSPRSVAAHRPPGFPVAEDVGPRSSGNFLPR